MKTTRIRSRQFNWCLQKVNTRSSEGCLRPWAGLALEDVNERGQQSCSEVPLSWCFSSATKNADVSPACLVAAFPIWNFEPMRLVLKHPNGLGGVVDLSQCLHMSFVFACAYNLHLLSVGSCVLFCLRVTSFKGESSKQTPQNSSCVFPWGPLPSQSLIHHSTSYQSAE